MDFINNSLAAVIIIIANIVITIVLAFTDIKANYHGFIHFNPLTIAYY